MKSSSKKFCTEKSQSSCNLQRDMKAQISLTHLASFKLPSTRHPSFQRRFPGLQGKDFFKKKIIILDNN